MHFAVRRNVPHRLQNHQAGSRIILIPGKLPRAGGAGCESGKDPIGWRPSGLTVRDLELIIQLHQRTPALIRSSALKEL
jgi:hypothetical protein